ncbi:MAG: hypothetical protein V4697_00125 [Patescibacteria group bacterium]
MREFQKKKKIRNWIYSPLTLLVLAILFIIIAKSLFGVYQKEKISAANLERERLELSKLTSREENLASSLEYLKTDAGIESEIRGKFRAVKEGEQVAVIIDGDASSTATTSTSTRGFWYRLFH